MSVELELSTDLATSREFAGILTKFEPESQSLCGSAPGHGGELITLILKVSKDLKLRALIDYKGHKSFVHRQSLEGRKLKNVEIDIPL